MEASIIKIGNSQGLIIPKKLLKALGNSKQVNINLKNGELIITPLNENKARSNWEEQFNEAIAKGFIPEKSDLNFPNDFDKDDWTW
jgi:antitoxin MazE